MIYGLDPYLNSFILDILELDGCFYILYSSDCINVDLLNNALRASQSFVSNEDSVNQNNEDEIEIIIESDHHKRPREPSEHLILLNCSCKENKALLTIAIQNNFPLKEG